MNCKCERAGRRGWHRQPDVAHTEWRLGRCLAWLVLPACVREVGARDVGGQEADAWRGRRRLPARVAERGSASHARGPCV